MRKFIVSMNLSLDGYMSGPNAELDWHFETWNDEMGEKLLEQLEKADTILLGRLTYEAMAKYWSFKCLEQNFPRQDLAIADKMNSHSKLVFSKCGTSILWNNTKFAGSNLKEEISVLKQQNGKNILLFGSGRLVSSFMQADLIDEYQLWFHPVILGKGKPLFKNLKSRIKLKLMGSVAFKSGVIAMSYAVVRSDLKSR
jgi:dihydrofolate reductase